MCAHCHGGIGASRAGWAETMRPKPPALAHAAQGWSLEEVNWIVDHGIKMSGMPAFGGTHEEATIWNRSEEHTSEIQSLIGNSYAVLCMKKKTRSSKCNKDSKSK